MAGEGGGRKRIDGLAREKSERCQVSEPRVRRGFGCPEGWGEEGGGDDSHSLKTSAAARCCGGRLLMCGFILWFAEEGSPGGVCWCHKERVRGVCLSTNA